VFIVSLLVPFLFLSGCGENGNPTDMESYTFLSEPPQITMPQEPVLPEPANIIEDRKVGYTENLTNHRFINCEISIKGKDIAVSNCEFINCIIYIDNSADILFENSIVRDLNKYEETSLRLYKTDNITVTRCLFVDNYIGLGVSECSAYISENRFIRNNGHNALVIGHGSRVEVTGNYFYGSFPHAILVLNREADPQAAVVIHNNLIDQTGEDAINFEDFRNADTSLVVENVITNTGWSAVLIEYNSWESNITVKGNWIEGTGIPWDLPLHPLNQENFSPGWGHGILIEDSSKVTVIDNRILGAVENGIEVTNAQDITVKNNGISAVGAGIGLHRYHESSLYREFSPLLPENAGNAVVSVAGNIFMETSEDYNLDDSSELIPLDKH
jgi:parallel beta-helix repeat protein